MINFVCTLFILFRNQFINFILSLNPLSSLNENEHDREYDGYGAHVHAHVHVRVHDRDYIIWASLQVI